MGVDLLTISKLLGHADTRITSRHYAHLCDQTLKAAAAKLPGFGHVAETRIARCRRFAHVTIGIKRNSIR
jgi:hypothetical protein